MADYFDGKQMVIVECFALSSGDIFPVECYVDYDTTMSITCDLSEEDQG